MRFPSAEGASEGMWLYVSLQLQVLVKVCGCTLLYCWRSYRERMYVAVRFPTAGGPSKDMWLYVALLLDVIVKVCGCTLLYCWRS